ERGPVFDMALIAGYEIALQHDACNGAAAPFNLGDQVLEDRPLAPVIFRAIAMRTVDEQSWFQGVALEIGGNSCDRLLVEVRFCIRSSKDEVRPWVSFRAELCYESRLVDSKIDMGTSCVMNAV